MAATVKAKFVVQRDDQKSLTRIDPYEGVVEDLDVYVAGCLDPGTKFVLRKPNGGAAFNTDNELASYLGTASPPTVVVDIGHTLPFSITGADGVPCSFEVENVQFGTRVCKLKELVGAHLQLGSRDSISMSLLVDPNAIPEKKRAAFVKKFCMPASAAAESLQRLMDRAELDEDFFCIFHGKSKHSLFIHNSAPASAASFSGAQTLGAAACPQPDQSAFSAQLGTLTQGVQRLGISDDGVPQTPPRGKRLTSSHQEMTPHKIAQISPFVQSYVAKLIAFASDNLPAFHTVTYDQLREIQKSVFGPFFKEGKLFPVDPETKKMKLFSMGAFFNEDGAVPKSELNESFFLKMESSVANSPNQVFVLIGKSGCGKTSTIVELGKKHFVLYIDVSLRNYLFPSLTGALGPWTVEEALRQNKVLKDIFRARFFPFVTAHLLHLIALKHSRPSLTPEEFFRDQLNGGGKFVSSLFFAVENALSKLDVQQKFVVLMHVLDATKKAIGETPVIALDEAQTADVHLPEGSHGLLSHFAENKENGEEWWDSFRQRPFQQHWRGGLSILCRSAMDICVPLVVCGTSLSLKDTTRAVSGIAKHDYEVFRIVRFPMCKDPWGLLESVLNLDGCTKPEGIDKLRGRFRFSASVLAVLPDALKEPSKKTKQDAFICAVDRAYQSAKKHLRGSIKNLIDGKGEFALRLLSRLSIAHQFTRHATAWLENEAEVARCLVADFASVVNSDNVLLQLQDEPLVFDAIEDALALEEFTHGNFLLKEEFDLLSQVRLLSGPKSSAKGVAIELIVRRTLLLYNGVLVSELPFVRGIDGLPEWAKVSKVHIDRIGTAEELGFCEDSQSMADARFLEAKKPGDLLVPANSTRPDAIAFLESNRKLREGYKHLLTCGIRFSCSDIIRNGKHGHEDNMRTTDPKNFFRKRDGCENSHVVTSLRAFEAVLPQIKGSLRIHVELPCVSGLHLASEVDGDDILVFITLNELDLFFNEDFFEDQQIKESFRAIKSFLRNFFDPSPAPAQVPAPAAQ